MIRFQPDTWRDALLRPIAMAAPNAGVYAEIMAPDLRFAAVVALLLLSAVVAWRIKWRDSPVVVLLLFVAASFAVWLFTTGNGRYFIPCLLIVGPLCVGLIHRLPFTRSLRLVMAMGIVLLQGFAVYENNPWSWWGLAPWGKEPFFQVELDKRAVKEPATYVTATAISYSLIAPRFPAASRWINISSQADPENVDGRRVQAVLAASKSIQLLIPSMPDHMTAAQQPSTDIAQVINGMLAHQKLALEDPLKCRLLPSRGLASQALKDLDSARPETVAKFGFWVCPLRYPVAAAAPEVNAGSPEINKALDIIEQACPRFFPPREATTAPAGDDFVRSYSSADMKLYVLGTRVYYKYWRAMNPELIGEVQDVLKPSFRMSCDNIRGRSGLPWERAI